MPARVVTDGEGATLATVEVGLPVGEFGAATAGAVPVEVGTGDGGCAVGLGVGVPVGVAPSGTLT
jgi:hypothetical protein